MDVPPYIAGLRSDLNWMSLILLALVVVIVVQLVLKVVLVNRMARSVHDLGRRIRAIETATSLTETEHARSVVKAMNDVKNEVTAVVGQAAEQVMTKVVESVQPSSNRELTYYHT